MGEKSKGGNEVAMGSNLIKLIRLVTLGMQISHSKTYSK